MNPDLAAIAQNNLALWQAAGRTASPVRVLTGDATELELPAGNCFLFLYNPFAGVVTRAVLDRIERQKHGNDAALYLLYQNENDATPLRGDARLELVWTGSLQQTEEDRLADPVSSPEDVTSLYRWVGVA